MQKIGAYDQTVELQMIAEPNNTSTRNAIIVEACVYNDWQHIGYIPKQKIQSEICNDSK